MTEKENRIYEIAALLGACTYAYYAQGWYMLIITALAMIITDKIINRINKYIDNMKNYDIMYEPLKELPGKEIIHVLKEEQGHGVSHIMGVPIDQLITKMESGLNFGQAVTTLRQTCPHSRYTTYKLQQNWT